jgi:hypothetical protein
VPEKFKEQYISEFKNDNQVTMACVVHDFVSRLAGVLQSEATSTTSEQIIRAIQESGTQNGACGTSSFVRSDSGEQFIRYPLTLKTIKGGKIENVSN